MKKVLFVATVAKHIVAFHIPYLEQFKEMGWETAVAACNNYEKPEDCVIPYCDTFYDVPFDRSPFNIRNLKAYKQLESIIYANHFDIIHCHTPVGAALTRIAAKKARKDGTKVLYTAHGFHFYKGAPLKNWLLYYPVEKVLSRWTDCLITINKEDYERAKSKFHAKKVEYVPGVGIDVSHFEKMSENREQIRYELREELGIPQDAYVLLSVGELNRNKNHQTVIRALTELNDPEMYYVICGSGELMNQLKKLGVSLGVEQRVILTGFRKDVDRFYQMADLFVFPSLREGLPVALMEAMASGLPCIVSSIRGNVDLVKEEQYSFAPYSLDSIVFCIKQNMIKSDDKGLKLFNFDTMRNFKIENVKKIMNIIYMY